MRAFRILRTASAAREPAMLHRGRGAGISFSSEVCVGVPNTEVEDVAGKCLA